MHLDISNVAKTAVSIMVNYFLTVKHLISLIIFLQIYIHILNSSGLILHPIRAKCLLCFYRYTIWAGRQTYDPCRSHGKACENLHKTWSLDSCYAITSWSPSQKHNSVVKSVTVSCWLYFSWFVTCVTIDLILT